MEGDFSTAIRFGDVRNGVVTFALRFPEYAVFRTFTCRTGAHSDFVCHDERRVEAHAELTNQLAVFRLVRTQGFEE